VESPEVEEVEEVESPSSPEVEEVESPESSPEVEEVESPESSPEVESPSSPEVEEVESPETSPESSPEASPEVEEVEEVEDVEVENPELEEYKEPSIISEFQSYTDPELDELWNNEVNFKQRDLILAELQRRNLFPSESIKEWDISSYPDIADPAFLQKLLSKREFAESLQKTWKPDTDPCEDNSTFEVTSVQRFNANFMSPKTPYMSALLYHGVGVGKTCAAVQITEGWLENYPQAEVFLVAPPTIQQGFIRTIFDKSKVIIGEGNEPNSAEQCTGVIYMKLTNTLYERDINKIEKAVSKIIRRRYKIFGYISFANYIRDSIKGIPDSMSYERKLQLKKDYIRKKFSGKLLIIDEAHNLRDVVEESESDGAFPGGKAEKGDAAGGKLLTPYLMDVLQYSEGMKFCALTATPMYNTYKEIIFILNLLLINDKKSTITEADIFDKDGNIHEKGSKMLTYISQRYVSFMRGENPISFPVRLFPTNIQPITYPRLNPRGMDIPDLEDYYNHLPLVPITLGGDVLKASLAFMNALPPGKGLNYIALEKLVHAGNFIVPGPDTLEGFKERTDINCLKRIFTTETSGGEKRYRAIKEGGAKWLGLGELATYSPKFEFLINRVNTCEGCVFAYTRFVNAGALPLALALEANGYTPYGRTSGLLANGHQTPGGKQCARCPKREKEHGSSNHTFTPAYYGLLTGDITISPHNEQTITTQRSFDNVDGSKMKIIIGSQISSEGVDLRFVRETHVIDSWFHLNKTEQILGRAIRFLSHCALPKEKRNNTVYLYVGVLPDSSRETGDLYSYRIGFKKAVLVGRVTRIMKQSAIDCNLNRDAIIIRGQDPINMIDSQGYNRNDININDMPFTAVCDWVETCEYKCNPTINISDVTIDDSMYDEFLARWRIDKLKKRIKEIFAEQPFRQSEDLWNMLSDIPRLVKVNLLTEIVDNKNFQIQYGDKSGYIRYCNGYYIFQPNVYADLKIPLAIRVGKFPIKRDMYTPIEYEIPEEEEEQKTVETESIDVIWESIEEWCTYLSTNMKYKHYPEQLRQRIIEISDYDREKIDKCNQILEMVEWFHISFHKSSNKNPESFRKTILFYFWDEWLTVEEQKFLVYSSLNVSECMKHNQYILGKIVVNFFINPKNGEMEYMCEGGIPCVKSIIDTIQRNKPIIKVNKGTTGNMYGFIVPKNGEFVFKLSEPSDDEKIGRGKECGNVSTSSGHITNLIQIGDILKAHHKSDFDLNRNAIFGIRKLKNSTRICTLMNLLIRFLDADKISDKRWFYRPVQAYQIGHKGIFRPK